MKSKVDFMMSANHPNSNSTEVTFNNLDIAVKQYFETAKQQLAALKIPPKIGYFYIHLKNQKDKKNYLCYIK